MNTHHYGGQLLIDREKRIKRIEELERLVEEYGLRAIRAEEEQANVQAVAAHNWDHMWAQLLKREAEIDGVVAENKALKAEVKRLGELAKSDELTAGAGYHHQMPSRPPEMIGCPLCTYECTCELRR